jgi:hypothetical protein
MSSLSHLMVTNFDTLTPSFTAVDGTYRRFRLDDPISYDVGYSRSGDRIYVPAGTITDFASVPRSLWAIFPPINWYAPAAILHDYMYHNHNGRTRKEVDGIFLEAMNVLGNGFAKQVTARILYTAVRVFGGLAWVARSGI